MGLNISKPPELIHLYREGLKQSGQSGVTVATQTEQIQEEKDDIILEQVIKIILSEHVATSNFKKFGYTNDALIVSLFLLS